MLAYWEDKLLKLILMGSCPTAAEFETHRSVMTAEVKWQRRHLHHTQVIDEHIETEMFLCLVLAPSTRTRWWSFYLNSLICTIALSRHWWHSLGSKGYDADESKRGKRSGEYLCMCISEQDLRLLRKQALIFLVERRFSVWSRAGMGIPSIRCRESIPAPRSEMGLKS